MSHTVQVELSGVLAERVALLVQKGIYEDEAAAMRAAAKAQFVELCASSDQMSLRELIRAHMRGELKPTPEADQRLEALAEKIKREGIVFEEADTAMRRIRQRWEFNGEEDLDESRPAA